MRISDWSSHVCSSNLGIGGGRAHAKAGRGGDRGGFGRQLAQLVKQRRRVVGARQPGGDRGQYVLECRQFSALALHQRKAEQDRKSVVLGKECVSTCRSRWSPYH